MRTSVIKPGLLVSLKTTVTGGVQYKRVDLNAPEVAADGAEVARWETTRITEDPAEHERAVKVRGKARSIIAGVCIPTAFGLLCPVDRQGDLDEAVKRARSLVEAHNASNPTTRVAIYTIAGRIASTDEEAMRSISSEMSGLLGAMNTAIDRLDKDAIREAANQAVKLSRMLDESQIQRVSDAIIEARKAANLISKRAKDEGEIAVSILGDIERGAINRARFAFLDDAPPAVEVDAMPQANAARFAGLDGCESPAPESESPPPPVTETEPNANEGGSLAASAS